MTHTELKQVILDYIRSSYKADYIGKLEIDNLDPIGYKVSIYLNNDYYPLVIMADLPDEEFIPFIKKEISNRNLVKNKYYKLTKLSPNEQTRACR